MKKRIREAFLVTAVMVFTGCSNQVMRGRVLDVSGEEKNKSLTLMVYMAADNDLESYAMSNLKAMEHSDSRGVNVLVLFDRSEGYDETEGNWTDTRLFKVVHDETDGSSIKSVRLTCPQLGLTAESETELDMANPEVLRKFIEFSKSNYRAEKYVLIIWGHGTGWRYFPENIGTENQSRAVAVDDRSGTYMSVKELGEAVSGLNLCVIGFDTCFGAVFENLYELKSSADYTVASPGVTPGSGWNYTSLLENISQGSLSAGEIALLMAQSSSVSTMVIENEKLGEFFDSFEEFSKSLSETITDADSRSSVLSALLNTRTYSYTQNPCDLYIDVLSMAEMYENSSNSVLSQAAIRLKDKVNDTVHPSNRTSAGIGVHLIPKSSSGALASVHSSDYVKNDGRTDQCAFIKESRWWVPTRNGNSGSLLDKLFYTGF